LKLDDFIRLDFHVSILEDLVRARICFDNSIEIEQIVNFWHLPFFARSSPDEIGVRDERVESEGVPQLLCGD